MQEFRGKLLVSIREYYDDDAGERRPGKKGRISSHKDCLPWATNRKKINNNFIWFAGISLSVEQWEKLKEAIPKIDQQLHDKS